MNHYDQPIQQQQSYLTAMGPNNSIEMLIDQIEECVEFPNDRNLSLTAAQILNTAYNLVFNMQSFFEDCKKWNACPSNKTMRDNFKAQFLQAQNELQLQQQTAQTSGYMGANAAHTHIPCDAFQHYQDAADALANLATATMANRKAFENLSNTVANLTQQVKDEDMEIASLKKCLNKHSKCPTTTTSRTKAATAGHMDTWSALIRIVRIAASRHLDTERRPQATTPWAVTWRAPPVKTTNRGD